MPNERAVVTMDVLKEMEGDLRARLNARLMLEPLSGKPLFPHSIAHPDQKPDGAALLEVLMIVVEYRERSMRGFGEVPEHWNKWMVKLLADWDTLKNGTPEKARFDGRKHARKKI